MTKINLPILITISLGLMAISGFANAQPKECVDISNKLNSLAAKIESGYQKDQKLAPSSDNIKELNMLMPELEKVVSKYPACKQSLDITVGEVVKKLSAVQQNVAGQAVSSNENNYKVDIEFKNWTAFKVPSDFKKNECDTLQSRNVVLQTAKIAFEAANNLLECYSKNINTDHVGELIYFVYGGNLIAARYELRYSAEVSDVSASGKINTVVTNDDIVGVYTKKYGKITKVNSWMDHPFGLDIKFTEHVWMKDGNEARLLQQENLMSGQWITILRYISYTNTKLKMDTQNRLGQKAKALISDKKAEQLKGEAP